MTLIPLSRDQHADLRMLPLTSFGFTAEVTAVSLFGSEIFRAAHEFPICFTAEREGYFPAGLLGLAARENLFVDGQGSWLAGYLPAFWRRGAFRLARIKDSDQWILCIEDESPLISRIAGQALFDADGKPTPLIDQMTQLLLSIENDRIKTLAACAELDRQGLMIAWDLKVTGDDGAQRRLDGLFKIDEAKFADCSADALFALSRRGALSMIYAHLLSLHKLHLLRDLAVKRLTEQKRAPPRNQDLDQVFGIMEDDPFIF